VYPLKTFFSLLLVVLLLSPGCVKWEKPYARHGIATGVHDAYATPTTTLPVCSAPSTQYATATTLAIDPEWFKISPFYERETEYDSIDVSTLGGKEYFIVSLKGKKHLLANGSLGDGYDNIQGLRELSDKPVFLATQAGRQFIVYDGEKNTAQDMTGQILLILLLRSWLTRPTRADRNTSSMTEWLQGRTITFPCRWR
jgi:hypothetical protein